MKPNTTRKLPVKSREMLLERQRAYAAAYRERHREWIKLANRVYRREYPERTRTATRKWREKNRDQAIAYVKDWTQRNHARFSAMVANWKARNRERVNRRARRDNAKVRAMFMQRIPQWADSTAIDAIYARCVEINRSTGIRHEVDHIIPLRGKRVSGLHVAENLQVIPKALNLTKSNNFTLGE